VQKLSSVLRKAGFRRSKSWASRVRGWHNHSPGYVISTRFDGSITVRHRSDIRNEASNAARVAEYAETLKALGGVLVDGEVAFVKPRPAVSHLAP